MDVSRAAILSAASSDVAASVMVAQVSIPTSLFTIIAEADATRLSLATFLIP